MQCSPTRVTARADTDANDAPSHSLVDASQYSLLLLPVLGFSLVLPQVLLLLILVGIPDCFLQGHPPVEVPVICTEDLEMMGERGKGREREVGGQRRVGGRRTRGVRMG